MVSRPPSPTEVAWVPRFGSPRLYLASLMGTPTALAAMVVQPLDVPEVLYGAGIAVAACPIYFMTIAGANAQGRPIYSWWGLRAQLWLHLGGAALSAVRYFGEPRQPPPRRRG